MRSRRLSPRRSQSGESWVSTLLWGVVALVVLVVGIKMLKPKYNEYKLESKLEEIVRMQGAPDSGAVKKEIMEMAVRENLPLTEEDVIVSRIATSTVVHVTMHQEVDLFVTKYTVTAEIEKQSNSY